MSDVNEHKAIHFNGLNGLRFFAAIAVVITHLELIKSFWLLPNNWNNPIIKILGSLGVYFFFVLSGFLITFLLLKEKEQTKNISIKSFYLRRILRIWPLYFLILIVGFFVLPNIDIINIKWQQANLDKNYWGHFFCYLLILPNIAYGIWGPIPHISQSWSIGIEEQFYLFWPLLIKYSRNLVRTLFVLFLGLIVFKILFLIFGRNYLPYNIFLATKSILAMSKFECMALGGLGAFFLYRKVEWFIKIIERKAVAMLSFSLLPILIFYFPEKIQDGVHIIYGKLFLIIIIHVCYKSSPGSILNEPILDKLGKISYGIYMYHLLIIPFVIKLLLGFNLNSFYFNVLLYPISIVTIIGISYISYEFFEKRFIAVKQKYEQIHSKA